KSVVLKYYKTVNQDAFKNYELKLEHVSNEKMRELTTEQLNEAKQTIDEIILDLQSNEAAYVGKSTKEMYTFALQYAQIMKQRTQLFLNDKDYMQLRDEYLTDNMQWIMQLKQPEVTRKYFLTVIMDI
ncbi:MAG: erythromycin esterase family protein, partial [Psychrobacillus psychrotolerans]